MTQAPINAIIFIEKNFLDLYGENFTSILRFPFPADSVEHMEIISKENFTSELITFFKTNKLPPFSATILLSDHFMFCKEIPTENATVAKEAQDVKEFLEATPFERVLSKIYRLDKREIIAATNEDFITTLVQVSNHYQSRIDSCVPTFLLGKNFTFQNGLAPQQAKILLNRINNVKPWSLPLADNLSLPRESSIASATTELIQTSTETETPAPGPTAKKQSNKRTIVLAIVFVFLILVLVGMFVRMSQQNSSPLHPTPTPVSQVVIPQQEIAPTSSAAGAFSATTEEAQLNVSIQYVNAAASEAAQVKSVLSTFGIQNVSTNVEQNVSGTDNIILFTSKVSAASRVRIVTEVQKAVPNISSQENDNLSSDVLILLPK